MKLEELLDKLENVRPAGTGYVAVCPAHDDREASLGVSESDDAILLNCYAGCDTSDVLEAMGLSFSDLYFSSRARNQGEPEAIYPYVDELGDLLYEVVRYPGKKFKQRHYGADGEQINNMDGVRRVLYRLPEVIAAVQSGTPVFICEGEKDTEALRGVGKVATCGPGGAGKWKDEYNDVFQGATVIIVAHRDEPGRNHASRVKAALLGVAANIFIVQAARGNDAADHLEAGLPTSAFEPLKERTRRGVISSVELAERALERLELTEDDLPGFVFTPEIPLVMRQGRMYAIAAYTGDGKTCFSLQGHRALSMAGRRCGYFSLEMTDIDLTNRLVAHRGVPLKYTEEPWRLKSDPAMLSLYKESVAEIREWESDIIFDSSITAERISDITRDREYEVIFVDHISRFSWGSERRSLEAAVNTLTNIALEQNVMVVVVCQLRKHQRGKDMMAYPRPTLQDFRETSMIGDDASMALAIWRQRDNAGMTYTGATEVIVLKNRHTTGAADRAGHAFFPHFDPDKQIFVPRGVVASDNADGHLDGAVAGAASGDGEAWV